MAVRIVASAVLLTLGSWVSYAGDKPVAAASAVPSNASAYVRPDWAFLRASPEAERPPEEPDETIKQVPGSVKTYTVKQIGDFFGAVNWFPNSLHAPMPDVVAYGRKPDVFACAVCHLTSGMGHAESSHLAGQPVDYLIRQVQEFRSGARKDPIRMTKIAATMSDTEIRAAAEWFSAIKPIKWLVVVETDVVPKKYGNGGRMQLRLPGNELEPLGRGIVELPQDDDRAKMRDPYSGFIAYVPKGSIAKGKQIVEQGTNGPGTRCALCHGANLRGLGDVPSITGTSPLYAAAQLYNFQVGTRAGAQAHLMQPVVENMDEAQMIAVTAYLSSLPP